MAMGIFILALINLESCKIFNSPFVVLAFVATAKHTPAGPSSGINVAKPADILTSSAYLTMFLYRAPFRNLIKNTKLHSSEPVLTPRIFIPTLNPYMLSQ